MGHQTAVELDQQIIGQPLGDIGRLKGLNFRGKPAPGLDAQPLVLVSPGLAEQGIKIGLGKGSAFLLLAPDELIHQLGPIAAITAEQLVRALAAQSDLKAPVGGGLAQHIGGKNGGVAGRIIHRRRDPGRQGVKVLGRHGDALGLDPVAGRVGERGAAFIDAAVQTFVFIPHRDGGHVLHEALHQDQKDGAVHPAGQEQADRNIGDQVGLHRIRHHRVKGGDGVAGRAGLLASGQGLDTAFLHNPGVFHHQGLAGKKPLDTRNNRLVAQGVFQL